MENNSKTIVYPNGDILNLTTVKKMICKYWRMTAAEKRAFDRVKNNAELEKRFKELYLK
jgi:hypothetical protein